MSHVFGTEHRGRLLVKAIKAAPPNPSFVTIYGRDGSSVRIYGIDAREAVNKFPDQWAFEPWTRRK